MNDKMKEYNEKKLELKIEKITKENEYENVGIGDLDIILNNILGGVNDK